MRENNELIYPLKNITRQEFKDSFPTLVKLKMAEGGTELIMIRLPDVITRQEFKASFPTGIKLILVNFGTSLIMIRLPDTITRQEFKASFPSQV